MGVYINREMPESCSVCFVKDCAAREKNKYVMSSRGQKCPLAPVPPHGRLIDADALVADLKRQCKEVFKTDAVSPDDFWITRNQAYNERLWTTWCESMFDYLKTIPTIVPAEEGE